MLFFMAIPATEDDRTKFEQLYLTYRHVMFYVANGVLRDEALAEDAVQQAFMRIIEHMEKISSVDCPQTKSFMVIIVKNIAINLYNSRKRKQVISLDELEGWMADSAETPSGAFEARDDYERLAALIALLPEGYRSALLLRYDHGYSTAEIASMLGLSEENVKKRLQRAKKKLSEALARRGMADLVGS